MKKKAIIAGLGILALLGAVGLVLSQRGDRLHAKARKDWKDQAIIEIARRAADTNWLAIETGTLKKGAAQKDADEGAWLTDHLILMTNGEWIVYASKCSKEDRRIHDIFLGRGLNGKWYYSTFHFCKRMLVLTVDEQPGSVAQFAETYFLREFDGISDDCLQKTWPPEHGPKLRFPTTSTPPPSATSGNGGGLK